MAMVVGNNINAINANRNLNKANKSLGSSIEKLSSGYRINTGKDGPADLIISEQLRSQKFGLERAVRNTTEANNVISIAEGAMNEMNSILKQMKALAIHSTSDGVVSPEQIEANQAEMDAAIKTLERIANNTRYSDQQLLNGGKEITYDQDTTIKGYQNNSLVDVGNTNIQQIFKRDGYAINIGFTGAVNADAITSIGDANMKTQASKAYLEVDTAEGSLGQVDVDGNLTQSMSFTLTGNLGSKTYSFAGGTALSEVVKQIGNYADSTGVNANMIFNSIQEINASADGSATNAAGSITGFDATKMIVFENSKVAAPGPDGTNNSNQIVTAVAGTLAGVGVYGQSTDGQGNMYIKVTSTGAAATDITYNIYKDASMSEESLIGQGVGATASTALNNSGLTGLEITWNHGTGATNVNVEVGDTVVISTGNILLTAQAADGSEDIGDFNVYGNGIMNKGGATAGTIDLDKSVASGVELGKNTSYDGQIWTKVEVYSDSDGTVTGAQVFAYKSQDMDDASMVAKSIEYTADEWAVAYGTADQAIVLDAIWNDEKTESTGLRLALTQTTVSTATTGFGVGGTYTGSMQFANLGARVYTTDYGSDANLQIQMNEGALFSYYNQADKMSTATLIDAGGTGTTWSSAGQDATLNINGKNVQTNGLTLNVASSDMKADIVFNAGKVGSTTIAQVGYGDGSVFTKIGALTISQSDTDDAESAHGDLYANYSALLTNACHNTTESLNDFTGGMQLQLGEGAGDQERTVVSVKAMNIDNLGKIAVTKAFDKNSAVVSTKNLSVADLQGGGIACLAKDSITAMKIIEAAIDDVATTRAELGALQSNMLQTNENNLNVAIENITLTESAIRDTDMASQMTEYTKQQVLTNVGMSMLSQANSAAQNVMQLLQ